MNTVEKTIVASQNSPRYQKHITLSDPIRRKWHTEVRFEVKGRVRKILYGGGEPCVAKPSSREGIPISQEPWFKRTLPLAGKVLTLISEVVFFADRVLLFRARIASAV